MLTMDQISIYMRMTQSYFLLLKPWKIQPRFKKIWAAWPSLMETWLLRLNIGKCKAISYSRRPELNTNYSISGVTVENIENMKDLGVTFDNKLKVDKHINYNINTAYQMLGIVERNFVCLTPDCFVVLYKAMICSHLEYAVSVWNPHHQSLIEQERSYRKQIAHQLRAQYVEGIYDNPVTLKSRLTVTQGQWKRNHWVDHTRLTIRRVIGRWILSWPWNVGQRSLKVIEISAIRKLGCGFLFAFYTVFQKKVHPFAFRNN